MNKPAYIAWGIPRPGLPEPGYFVPVCPICGKGHPWEPGGPCGGTDLYRVPEGAVPSLDEIVGITEPWLVLDGRGDIASQHAKLADAHAALLEIVAVDPLACIRNAKADLLRVFTNTVLNVSSYLARVN